MKYILTSLIFLSSLICFGQELLTTAEKSNFTATSTHEEVLNFIEELDNQSDIMRVENIAITTEGRNVPMMILADPMINDPAELKDDDRLVVYIQANIHAGEVEGKESTQMLARDILKDKHPRILKDMILLIVPNLNPDGNEKFSPQNRTNQNGPEGDVGVRHNGQWLDLNRDAMKAETPEIKGVIENVLNKWDPAVNVDCHTTNGSYHEEPVTYVWMTNPNGDRQLINYMRDKMMPWVNEDLRDNRNTPNCFYGVFFDRTNPEKGWTAYAWQSRYLINYIGLRNRLSILNENYAYAPYKDRVLGCYHFLWSVLDYSNNNRREIYKLILEADQRTVDRGISVSDSFAIKIRSAATPEPITIQAFDAIKYTDENGRTRYRKADTSRSVTVPYIADYFMEDGIRRPKAYLLEKADIDVISLLKTHGIEMKQLKEDTKLEVERFKIEKLSPSERINQGHYTNNIEGEYVTENRTFKAGTYIVYTSQQLGNLIPSLLEPQAEDGLFKWNYWDRYLVPQWGRRYYDYPVYRIIKN